MDSNSSSYSKKSNEIWNGDGMEESIWGNIQRVTYSENKEYWHQLLNEDETQFRLKFKDSFLEACKTWLSQIYEFMEEDETWASIIETKSRIQDNIEENDEALLSAMDMRKYKIFKTIDWNKVETEVNEDNDSDETEEDEEENDEDNYHDDDHEIGIDQEDVGED